MITDPQPDKPMTDEERRAQYRADLEQQIAALEFRGKPERAAEVRKVLEGLQAPAFAPESATIAVPETAVAPKPRARKPKAS